MRNPRENPLPGDIVSPRKRSMHQARSVVYVTNKNVVIYDNLKPKTLDVTHGDQEQCSLAAWRDHSTALHLYQHSSRSTAWQIVRITRARVTRPIKLSQTQWVERPMRWHVAFSSRWGWPQR